MRGPNWLGVAQDRYEGPRVITSGVAYLEEPLAAAMELHAEPNAAGLTGAGELSQQRHEDGARQHLLQGGQYNIYT